MSPAASVTLAPFRPTFRSLWAALQHLEQPIVACRLKFH